jgi:hypothetical protein
MVRYVVLAGLVVASPAFAQPPGDPDAAFAACKARRRALTREAMKITDMIERGRQLALMPICRRFEDRSVEIVGPMPPPPPLPSLLEVRPEVGLVLGMGSWQVSTGMSLPAEQAPFLELEAGGRLRALSVVAFGGYTQVKASFDYFDYRVLRLAHYDARDTMADGGIKARLRVGPLAFGVGFGVEEEHETGNSTTEGPRDEMHELGMVESDIGYTLATHDRYAVRLLAIATGALGGDGSIWSARLALGIQR